MGTGLSDDDVFADADQAGEAWDELTRKASAQLDRVQRLSAEVDALRVSASSRRGGVTVEVNGAGIPTAVRLSEATSDWSPAQTSMEIMKVLHLAHVALARRVQEIVASSVGKDSTSGAAVMTGLQRRLGITGAEVEERR